MGVHPEPAPCADDVRRLVLGDRQKAVHTAAGQVRTDGFSQPFKIRSRRRRLVAAVTVGLAVSAGVSAAMAHDGFADRVVASAMLRSDLRGADQPVEWGGVALKDGEAATQAVVENAPGSAPVETSEAGSIRFGDRSVSRPLVETIVRASENTGVDPAYMMALADKESRFDTDVKASSSSAQGLFQFLTGTWLEMVRDYGAKHGLVEEAAALSKRGGGKALRKRILALRNDPYVAGVMAGEMVNRDRARIEGRIGRSLKTTELYLSHFLGSADAGRLLSLKEEAPEKNAPALFARAAKANRSIFVQNGRSLSVGEVHERLDEMIDRRLSQYQAVARVAAGQGEEAHPEDATKLDARLLLKSDIVPPVVAPTAQ